MIVLLTGALAGFVHVLSGPDHLAAVAPLAVSDRARGWYAGWTWGLGHTAGVVAIAALAVLLREWLPPIDAISAWSERLVGVALIGIGAWALRRSLRIEPQRHAHGAVSHDHLHVQSGPRWVRGLGHAHASFYMGVLHGIAGSSHFLGVLPALALPTRATALIYITAFGIGSIAAMTAFAAALGSAGARVQPGTSAHRGLMLGTAVMAVGVGGWWLV